MAYQPANALRARDTLHHGSFDCCVVALLGVEARCDIVRP